MIEGRGGGGVDDAKWRVEFDSCPKFVLVSEDGGRARAWVDGVEIQDFADSNTTIQWTRERGVEWITLFVGPEEKTDDQPS